MHYVQNITKAIKCSENHQHQPTEQRRY